MWDATRRASGSAWAGLLPAGIVLLGPDQIFLEHTIMSEPWVVFALSVGFWAVVHAGEAPQRWFGWPLVAGTAFAAAGMIRSAVLPIIPVAVLSLLLWSPMRGGWRRWRGHARAAVGMAATSVVLLVGLAGAAAHWGTGFEITPSPGWYLYGRVAQFADCTRFTPPPGTAGLGQTVPPSRRGDDDYYMFDPRSPAVRLFGGLGAKDSVVGGWARRALEAQFGDFLATGWSYLRGYWVPSWLPSRLQPGPGLDPQLDWTFTNAFFAGEIQQSLEQYYDRFTVHPHHTGLHLLHDVQRVIRFGATWLFITTILLAIGLVLGSRRIRVALLLFGVGGLSLILAPAFTVSYTGRYTVPMAAPMMAAAGITFVELLQRMRAGRPAWRGKPRADG
jgi:hypothetical protein